MKIVADDKIPFLKGVLEPHVDEVLYLPGGAIQKSDVVDADALIVRTRTLCNAGLLEGTKVKLVVTATIGTDHFDIPWLEKAGILWKNAPGCNSGSVRQYIGSVLSLLIQQGLDPAKTTLGIVGVGMVGSKVAQLATTLGMRVLLNDPPRARREPNGGFVEYESLLRASDIITFHTPLETEGPDASYHLFNERSVDILKPGAVVINSSRGEVTSSQAFIKGLEAGRISKLVLDVWESEPDISKELHAKVWLGTPHIAGYSADGKANGTSASVQQVSRFFGLGIDNWQPMAVPEPESTIIRLENTNMSPYQIAAQAILASYDIREDDARLRANPELFEKQRGAYPLRREFGTWRVALGQASMEAVQLVEGLGFRIV